MPKMRLMINKMHKHHHDIHIGLMWDYLNIYVNLDMFYYQNSFVMNDPKYMFQLNPVIHTFDKFVDSNNYNNLLYYNNTMLLSRCMMMNGYIYMMMMLLMYYLYYHWVYIVSMNMVFPLFWLHSYMLNNLLNHCKYTVINHYVQFYWVILSCNLQAWIRCFVLFCLKSFQFELTSLKVKVLLILYQKCPLSHNSVS